MNAEKKADGCLGTREKRLVLLSGAVLAAALVSACGGTRSPSGTGASSPAATPQQTLTVSAAASLTDVFDTLGRQFEQRNSGAHIWFNYGGSSDLAQQIVNGAPADVFAAASPSTMDTVIKAGLVNGAPKIFATNTLRIAVAPGNPKDIHTFADLARPDLKVVVGGAQVPCGAATIQVEKTTGITLKPVSEEADVRAALSEVTSGDVDAGVVYVTDVKSTNGKVDGVDFPEANHAVNDYPIAALNNAPNPDLAARWIALVEGPDGRTALSAAGFTTP